MIAEDRIIDLRPEVGDHFFRCGMGLTPRPGDMLKPGEYDLSIVTLAAFDHDYLGWHAHVQAWDHLDPDAEWTYLLVLGCSELDWQPRIVHDWGNALPSFAEVGRRVDAYLTAPEYLRFILR